MRRDGKAQAAHQAQHLLIVGQHIADHRPIRLFTGAINQRPHQAAPKAAALPTVIDHQRELHRFAIGGQRIAGAAHLLLNVGLVILLATPVGRVVVSVGEYALERDWVFVLLTTIVLVELVGSLIAAVR